jgi:Uncharacterized conserved protein CG6151-P
MGEFANLGGKSQTSIPLSHHWTRPPLARPRRHISPTTATNIRNSLTNPRQQPPPSAHSPQQQLLALCHPHLLSVGRCSVLVPCPPPPKPSRVSRSLSRGWAVEEELADECVAVSLADEFRSRNFSIYAQWLGVLSIFRTKPIVLPANSGRSLHCAWNRQHLSCFPPHHLLHHLLVSPQLERLVRVLIWNCRVTGVVLIFVEIPLLLRVCPTSEKFDVFVRRFNENWPRAGMYIGYETLPLLARQVNHGSLAAVQFCSIIINPSSLIAAAVILLLTGSCYGITPPRACSY